MFIIDIQSLKIVRQKTTNKNYLIMLEYQRKLENKDFLCANFNLIRRSAQRAEIIEDAYLTDSFIVIEDLLADRENKVNQRLREYDSLGFL